MGYKRPPSLRPAATTTLLNRDFVVDPAQVDALPVPHDASHDVDRDCRDIRDSEVLRRVRAVRAIDRPVRPLVKHPEQKQRADRSCNRYQWNAAHLITGYWRGVV